MSSSPPVPTLSPVYRLEADLGEYTLRTATAIETAAPARGWLNQGIFVGSAGRGPAGVAYEFISSLRSRRLSVYEVYRVG